MEGSACACTIRIEPPAARPIPKRRDSADKMTDISCPELTCAHRLDGLTAGLEAAERRELLARLDDTDLSGYSGAKIVSALQHFCAQYASDKRACYLEVGVFQGLTLLSSAAAVPSFPCYGLDNFAYFDPRGENLGIVESRRAAIGATNVHVINADYEDAFADLRLYIVDRCIAVYFVDGPHDYRSQMMCLELALPYLHPEAVIVVDDSNYAHVRQANRDFLAVHPEFKLLFEAYTRCHPANMDASQLREARDGWWNGINVLVRDPCDLLERRLPPTVRDRSLFENDHFTHTVDLGRLLPEAGGILGAIRDLAPTRFLRECVRLKYKISAARLPVEKFRTLNTGSEDLPSPVMVGRRRRGAE